MRKIETQFEAVRFCGHRDYDGSLAQCHEYSVMVRCGCETKSGQIQLRTIWAEEDGDAYFDLFSPYDAEVLQEVYEALDAENCRSICAEALDLVSP